MIYFNYRSGTDLFERKMFMKTIGERIREYRKAAKLTQEQLAARLNVSFQSVSKWETNNASPDLSLIIPIARLFGISADELLGMCDSDPDSRYDELKEAYEHTFKTEDFAERQCICEAAVSEYPGDMRWLSNLAWVISNRSFEYGDEKEYVAEQEKAIKLFDAVIKNCSDELLRSEAIEGITQLLSWRGRRDEARQYVELLPERQPFSREQVLENCLSDEELIIFKQNRIKSHLEGILWDLSLLAPYTFADTGKAVLCALIPDGNYLEFNHSLYYAVRQKINGIIKKDNPDRKEILRLLKEMKSCAAEYDRIVFEKPGIYRYTSPVFDRIETDTRDWFGNEGKPMSEDFREYLNDHAFDFLRIDIEFGKLFK